MAAPNARRALTNVGGDVETGGDRRASALLVQALNVAQSDQSPPVSPSAEAGGDASRAHVHGFHAYPARMHPDTASRLLNSFVPPHGVVLDPFAGSGTVLVEARLLGLQALGADLNPLAVKLSRLKVAPPSPAACARILQAAQDVRARADERRKTRAGATHRYGQEDVALFAPHVLLELDGLRAGILEVTEMPVREVLLLVLSAILVKVSQKESDTSEQASPRRIAAGYTAKLFFRKTEELIERLTAFAELLPPNTPSARIEIDDAMRLASVKTATVDAIITSPPYAATYDYVAHHAARLRWLSLDTRLLEGGEMGARRRYRALSPAEAEKTWLRELAHFLESAGRVAKVRAPMVMLIADSAVGSHALRADELVLRAAEGTAFRTVARATQRRPHFHGPTARAFSEKPRGEHALLLERL